MRVVRESRKQRRKPAVLVGIMAFALIVASCGSGSKPAATSTSIGSGATSITGGAAPESKTLGPGVTAKTIKVGVVLINYDMVKQYIHNTDGNQQQTYQVFVNDINKHGGVGGRQIVPEYYTYTSIGSAGPLAACTSLTEDKKVFATFGVLYDPTGAGQLCFVNQHKSILITHELTQAVIDKATTPGLLLTVSATPERGTQVLLSLLKQEHTLSGKTVAVLGEDGTKASVDSTILPGLKKLGVKTGSTGILTISGADTTIAQAQLDSFIERWKTEGVNAVMLSGDDVVATQFVTKLRKQIPGVLLMTDSAASAQHNAASEPNPNPFDGMLTAQALPAQQNFLQPTFQACAKTYKDAIGTPVIAPADLKAGPDGNKVEVYDAMEVACEDLAFFKYVAEKVGPYLNDQNWVQTVNNLGKIDNVIPGTHYASIHTGKYDASYDSGLASYDHTIEDFKLTTPIINARNS
jgi:hypothetical protein